MGSRSFAVATGAAAAASTIRVGALLPLTPPGWVEAGRNLLAGLELAVRDANRSGGVGGRSVELIVRDTRADPVAAAEAVEELAQLGAVAITGGFHSVATRGAALSADRVGIPFLCSSAVLDGLTDEPSPWIARIAPAQSRAWEVYAEFLLGAGHRRVAVATGRGAYWEEGTRIVRHRIEAYGGTLAEIDMTKLAPRDVCDRMVTLDLRAVLILVGHPEPAVSIVKAVRRDPRLVGVLIGAPAGQPEYSDWIELLGDAGGAVPFLRYLPERMDALGARVGRDLRDRLGEAPSFVAFEGYDAVGLLVESMRTFGVSREGISSSWHRSTYRGTRGPIWFSRVPGVDFLQWAWPPIQVVDRDPANLQRLRVLHASYSGDDRP